MNSERNTATLRELFSNLGPGEKVWHAAYEKALAPECTWWVQGWPLMIGMAEAKAQVTMLKAVDIHANPILEWRNVETYNNGNTINFERRGSVANSKGETLADWDIMGVFQFNDDGKIKSIRDYFDNTSLYAAVSEFMTKEQIESFHATSRVNHPLSPDYQADSNFYRNMCEQMTAGTKA